MIDSSTKAANTHVGLENFSCKACGDNLWRHFCCDPYIMISDTCESYFYGSAWLDPSIPRYLAEDYFWLCLWKCFWKRLAFELVPWGRRVVLPSVGRHHSIFWGTEFALCLMVGLNILPFLALRPSHSVWNLCCELSGSKALEPH